MRAPVTLGLLMLAMPSVAMAGPAPQDDTKRLVCVKKAAEPARVGQRAGQPTTKCRWIQRIPAVIDPTPTFIL